MIRFFEKSILARKVSGTLLRVLGLQSVTQENEAVFIQAHCEGVISKLINDQKNTRLGVTQDFRRIRSVKDYQRLIPVRDPAQLADLYQIYLDKVHDPGIQKFPQSPFDPLNHIRKSASSKLLINLAGLIPWRILDSTWIISSDIYESQFSWADFPNWFRLFARSPGEKIPQNWQGLWTTFRNFKSESLFELVMHREKVPSSNPALLALECITEELPEAISLRAELKGKFQVIPIWVESPGPVAFLDPTTEKLRFLLNENLFPEFIPLGSKEKDRQALWNLQKGVEYKIILSAPGGLWACETGMAATMEKDINQLDFAPLSLGLWSRRLPKPLTPTKPSHPFPPHPRTADTPAKLAETRNHIAW